MADASVFRLPKSWVDDYLSFSTTSWAKGNSWDMLVVREFYWQGIDGAAFLLNDSLTVNHTSGHVGEKTVTISTLLCKVALSRYSRKLCERF